ncbi:MAG: glycosyl transferase family 2 [Acidimicrobiia bacterium]|nr:glycosyl transferase family 2 [Acidimicrobiia bacterium]
MTKSPGWLRRWPKPNDSGNGGQPTVTDSLNPAVDSVSVFFPCYNDADTIERMVVTAHDALCHFGAPFEIIVVNDGSTDRSAEVLAELSARVPELRVVTHSANRGYGGALITGFTSCTNQWVFYTDGDGQYDPSEILDLLKEATAAVDWVQGWKIERGDSWVRKVAGRAYHHTVRLLFRLQVRDTDCDFRLIRKALLERVTLTAHSGAVCAEMMYQFRKAGGRVVEVPVHHYAREFGTSEFFKVTNVTRSLVDLTSTWLRLVVVPRLRLSKRLAAR